MAKAAARGLTLLRSLRLDWAAWVTAVATFVSVWVGIWAVWHTSNDANFADGVDLVTKFDERFDTPEFRAHRRAAAVYLRDKGYTDPKRKTNDDLEEVLDLFETLGYLMHRGAVDHTMVWHTFSWWVNGYCSAGEEYIRQARTDDPTTWEDLDRLEREMLALGKRRNRAFSFSQNDVDEFLVREIGMETDEKSRKGK